MAACAKASSLEEERRKTQPRATHAKKVSGSGGNGGGLSTHVVPAPTLKAHPGPFAFLQKNRKKKRIRKEERKRQTERKKHCQQHLFLREAG